MTFCYQLQYSQALVRSTHQSMPIVMIWSVELRRLVPTVGGIQVVLRKDYSQKNMSTVMVPNLY